MILRVPSKQPIPSNMFEYCLRMLSRAMVLPLTLDGVGNGWLVTCTVKFYDTRPNAWDAGRTMRTGSFVSVIWNVAEVNLSLYRIFNLHVPCSCCCLLYFEWLLYLAFSANLGLLHMLHSGMDP